MKKQLYLLLIWFLPIFISAQISDKLSISKKDIKFEKINGYDKINLNSDFRTNEVGYPELPVFRVSYVLPVDVTVSDITFLTKTKQRYEQNFNIIPVQQPITTDNQNFPSFTQPKKSVYQSTSAYPNKIYEIESDRFYMGYHLITLRIYPFEYIPLTQILNYYTQLEFTINYSNGTKKDEVSPITQNLHRAEQCKSLVQSLIRNPNDVEKFGSNVQTIRDGKNIIQNFKCTTKSYAPQKTKSLSVLNEQVPDYIIITNNALKSTFQTLADWKTKKGVFTIIKTTEEISANYQGTDTQEKIRNYIIESWGKWGNGLFVLLGGGNSVVPTRMVLGDVWDQSTFGNENVLYPADMYYATYINNWNSNLNSKFNEHIYTYSTYSDGRKYVSNNVDVDNVNFTLSGIFLGRIQADNVNEASTMINKIIKYEKADLSNNLSYLQNHLYADYFSRASVQYYTTNTTNNIVKKFMIPYASGNYIEFNHDNFFNALNDGRDIGKFHFVYHMDHGGSQGISTSSEKGQGVSKSEIGSLTNGDAYQIFMSGSCHSANFAEDCFAKYYLNNPNGGGVAYIGNTDWGLSGESQQLTPFLSSLFNSGLYAANRFDIGAAFQKIITSGVITKKWHPHLLGDPEMQVWTDVPQALNCTTSVSAILLGEQQLGVTISNLPSGQKAYICIQKDTEVYTTQEVSTNGTYYIPVKANTPGAINVTVTSHNFFPYETMVYANQSTAPNLYVSSIDFKDGIGGYGIGDGNGKNDAGETINLGIEIKNTGINTANAVSATLICNNPSISISGNSGSFGTINSGSTVSSYQYNYTINNDAPEILSNASSPVQFTLSITDVNNSIWTHKFNIDIFNSDIKQRNKTILSTSDGDLIIEANEIVTFNIDLQNVGQALGKNISAVLSSNSSSNIIQSCSNSSRSYGDVSHFETINNNSAFQFTAGSGYVSTSALNFNLQIINEYGKTWNYQFNLNDKPSAVSNVGFSADVSEIDLYWTPISGIGGYNIYRCNVGANDIESGSYVKLNNTPVSAAFFNDINNLNTLTKYYYKITAVSVSGNESLTTRLLAWTSYPKKYLFPVTIDPTLGNFSTSINVADVNNDGKKEIFAGTTGGNDKGYLVGLDYYGNDLFNIDNNVTTYSGFAKLGYVTTAIPAIGDLNRIGKSQIIQPTRDYGAGKPNAVFCFDVEDINPIDNKPDLKWKVDVAEKQFYRGVIVSNIDNSANGSLEIVTYSDERGCISIYNSIGTLLQDIECANTYAAISVADIDNDGDKEIIQASGTGIHVWHHNGTSYLGTSSLYSLSLSGYRFVTSVVVCDIDNDGQKEILTFAIQTNSPNYAKLFAIKNDGTLVSGFDGTQTITTNSNWNQELAVGDLDNDGNLEVVTFANDGIKVWNNSAQLVNSIFLSDIVISSQPILSDVDGDNEAEIICGSTTNNNIYAFKMNGSLVMGFPLKTSMAKCGGINISDIDNDGKNELIATNSNRIEMWQTDGLPSRIEWGSARHNQYNTGEYQTICEPTIINTNTIWNSNQGVCGDVIVKSGTLTIGNSSNISMDSSSMIIVMSGAALVVDSGHILNANIKAMSGSSITLTNNGSITLGSNAEFYTETGTNLDIQYGSIDK